MGTLEGDAHGRSVTYLSASSRYAEIDSEVVTEQSRKDTIVGRQMYKQIAIMEVTITQVGTPMEDKQSFFFRSRRRTPEYGNSSWERGKCDDHSTSRDRLGLIARTSSATRALKQPALGGGGHFDSLHMG